MKNVLIVWELIPETTELYMVQVDNKEFEILKRVNCKYINIDDMTPEMDYVNYALMQPSWIMDETKADAESLGVPEEVLAKWHQFKVEIKEGEPFIPSGMIDAVKKNGILDRLFMGMSLLGVSVPVFMVAMVLQYFLAYRLNWLPISGVDSWRTPFRISQHLREERKAVLPSLLSPAAVRFSAHAR